VLDTAQEVFVIGFEVAHLSPAYLGLVPFGRFP